MLSARGMHGIGLLVLGFAAACGKDTVSAPSSAQSALTADAASGSSSSSSSESEAGGRRIALRDDCDPRDPGWAAIGGCLLRRGAVNLTEFRAFIGSPLVVGMVGHPAWSIDPVYMKTRVGKTLRVTNEGGRGHTFTEVKQFGGGRVPPLNVGSPPAPECILTPGVVDPTFLAPGGALQVQALTVGNHKFMCCLHPWMRQVVKVGAGDDRGDH